MLHRHAISDSNWERIKDLLPGRPGQNGWIADDNRLFINAVLWILKTGAPWRDLPERFGNWNSVWKRFDRWASKGTWELVFEALQDPDLEWLALDSTIIRAHPCAAGAKKTDGTGGQEADVSQAIPLIDGHPISEVIGDKGYDSQKVVAEIERQGGTAVIPSKKNAVSPRKIDWDRYKDRNLVERFWSRIKHCRRVATRFEKKAQHFLAFVQIASVLLLLK